MKRIWHLSTALLLSLAMGISSPTAAKQLPSDTLLKTKFALIHAASPLGLRHCGDIIGTLNQPTIYDSNDLAASLLATRLAMMWQVLDRSPGKARPFRTIGEYRNHDQRTEQLELDLNNDGTADLVTRQWLYIKGQAFTKLYVGQSRNFEPITYDTLHVAIGRTHEAYPTSSFYLFEVVELDSRVFLIALEAINPGIQWPDRSAYVLHMNAAMQPEVDCIMKTTIFGD